MKILKKSIKSLVKFVRANWVEVAALTIILLAAAFLRLYRIAGYMTFLGDEGRDVLVVKRMIVDHKWTLLGPTASVGGFFLGPIYYYFMIPFLWAFQLNPVGPAVMVALFGVATVFLIWKVGRDFFNARVGLLAATLYTISPLIIAYSRSSWNPNPMPFFSLLAIWVLWRAVLKKNYRLLGLVGLLLGIALQLHYLATFLMVIVGIYWWLFSPQKKVWQAYLWLGGGFILGWSPFLLFEIRHAFPNFRTLYRFLLFGEETGFALAGFLPTIKDLFFRLFNRLVTNNQRFLALVCLFVSLAIFLFHWRKTKKQRQARITNGLLLLWLFLGVFLFTFYRDDIYDYYLSFMFPLPFLLTAFALVKIGKKGKLGWLLAASLTLWLLIVNLKGVPFRYPPNHQLNQVKEIASIIFGQAQNKPFNFALVTGSNSDHGYRYFLEIWGNSPIVIENPQVDPERKTVTDQLFVVCETLPCHPLGHPLWEIAGFGRAEIDETWTAPAGVQVTKLIHFQPE